MATRWGNRAGRPWRAAGPCVEAVSPEGIEPADGLARRPQSGQGSGEVIRATPVGDECWPVRTGA